MSKLIIKAPFDAHVHLRQGALSQLVTPHVRQGGFRAAFVMPNTVPPLRTPDECLAYVAQLRSIAPDVRFLPSLYLTRDLTPALIAEAHARGIVGVKSYPRGVTTNSDGGVGMEGYAVYDDVFAAMENCGMVLNLHGEVPSDAEPGTCVLNAEERFLPHLREIVRKFPRLRIVLEHCTTAAAVECVRSLPDTVAATITAHHLALTIDDVVSSSLAFCKPVAKYPTDRDALREAVRSGNPKFFLGSDSAPHPLGKKIPAATFSGEPSARSLILPCGCAAGVYTSAHLLPLCATIFEESDIPLENLENFVSTFGRAFYGIPVENPADVIVLEREETVLETAFDLTLESGAQEYLVPFWAGKRIPWRLMSV